jgi:hypothetical protein
MFSLGKFEKPFVAVDAEDTSVWSNSLCNSCGNRAGAAADIKHAKPRPQQCGKAAVVPLKISSPKDAGIGPV